MTMKFAVFSFCILVACFVFSAEPQKDVTVNAKSYINHSLPHCGLQNAIDNSKQQPGKYSGIAVYAATENAQDCTIGGNTVRDTQKEPTQWVGIEEKNGKRKGKVTIADNNVIKNNTYSDLKTADIVRVGKNTRIDESSSVRIISNEAPAVKE